MLDPDVWYTLGTIFLRTNRPQLAVQAYDAAVNFGRDDLHLWHNRALAYAALASSSAAEARQRAVERNDRRNLDGFIKALDALVPANLARGGPTHAAVAAK